MAKKIKVVDVLQLAEKRDKKLKIANQLFLRMKKLEVDAEELDMIITDTCNHPKEHLKLKHFTEERTIFPQKTMWLCTICYQAVDFDPKEKEKALKKSVDLLKEAWDEIPTKRLGSRKQQEPNKK